VPPLSLLPYSAPDGIITPSTVSYILRRIPMYRLKPSYRQCSCFLSGGHCLWGVSSHDIVLYLSSHYSLPLTTLLFLALQAIIDFLRMISSLFLSVVFLLSVMVLFLNMGVYKQAENMSFPFSCKYQQQFLPKAHLILSIPPLSNISIPSFLK